MTGMSGMSLEWSGTTGMSGKTGKTGMSGKTEMSGMTGVPLKGLVAGMPGMFLEGLVRHTDEFLERFSLPSMRRIFFPGMKVSLPSVCSSSTRRALCLLHVELDSGWRILWMHVCRLYVDGYPCRIGAEESCRTSSCRIAVLEVSVKTVVPLL